MTHPHRSNAHRRALIVIAIAFAASQALGASHDPARNANARNYQALVSPPNLAPATSFPLGGCDGRMDDGTGDNGCGSLTGGPVGGNGS